MAEKRERQWDRVGAGAVWMSGVGPCGRPLGKGGARKRRRACRATAGGHKGPNPAPQPPPPLRERSTIALG